MALGKVMLKPGRATLFRGGSPIIFNNSVDMVKNAVSCPLSLSLGLLG